MAQTYKAAWRAGLLGLAVALFGVVFWQSGKAPLPRLYEAPAQTSASGCAVDYRHAGAAFALAFICFHLMGAYDREDTDESEEGASLA